jgi:hypothetical protein
MAMSSALAVARPQTERRAGCNSEYERRLTSACRRPAPPPALVTTVELCGPAVSGTMPGRFRELRSYPSRTPTNRLDRVPMHRGCFAT